jgi:hypothetical protein
MTSSLGVLLQPTWALLQSTQSVPTSVAGSPDDTFHQELQRLLDDACRPSELCSDVQLFRRTVGEIWEQNARASLPSVLRYRKASVFPISTEAGERLQCLLLPVTVHRLDGKAVNMLCDASALVARVILAALDQQDQPGVQVLQAGGATSAADADEDEDENGEEDEYWTFRPPAVSDRDALVRAGTYVLRVSGFQEYIVPIEPSGHAARLYDLACVHRSRRRMTKRMTLELRDCVPLEHTFPLLEAGENRLDCSPTVRTRMGRNTFAQRQQPDIGKIVDSVATGAESFMEQMHKFVTKCKQTLDNLNTDAAQLRQVCHQIVRAFRSTHSRMCACACD